MESVNKMSDLNSISENKSEMKSENQKIDRVVLDSASIKIVDDMIEQVESHWGDLVHVSQKDIVNFLIQKRPIKLTEQEIEVIRLEKYDIVKALKRATIEAIKAKQSGKEIEIEEILKIIQTPGVITEEAFKSPSGRKKKLNTTPSTKVNNFLNETYSEAVKTPSNDLLQTFNSESKTHKFIENSQPKNS